MKNIITKSLFSALLLLFVGVTPVKAQNKVEITGGADLVSSYVWRGSYCAGASVQPSLYMTVGGFTLGTWGSTDFGGNGKKEVDITVSYKFRGLSFIVTDYWSAGEGAYKYFHYSKGRTSHSFEGTLAYELPINKFPLTVAWNTIFLGNDYNYQNKRSYSTYIELSYPFSIRSVDLNAAVGFVPWYSPAFLPVDGDGFRVCNVSLRAEKAIKLSSKFSLPIFSQLIFNPAREDVHLVFGLSLKF